MTFAVLGSIGAAVGTGLGAVSGGIAAGATALGASAGLASAIGTIGTGALVGSGLGAAGSAIMGQDPGKGAAFGALGGGLTGGLTSGIGALAGSEAGAAGGSFGGVGADASSPIAQEAFSAGNVLGQGSPLASAPVPTGGWAPASGSLLAGAGEATPGVTANLSEQMAQGIGGNIAGAGTQQGSMLGSLLANVPESVTKGGANMALNQGIQGIQNAQIGAQNEKAGRQAYMGDAAQQERDRRNAYTIGSQTMGMAAGGEVPLEDGDWIIPADVVSALGNGSTDAGASFLNDFFGLSNGSSGNIA